MSDLIPSQGSSIGRRSQRAARAIDNTRANTQVRQNRIANEADVASEKVEQVTYLTASAMTAVSKVGALQKQLEQQLPELAGRLSALADAHLIIASQVIEDARRDMRRY